MQRIVTADAESGKVADGHSQARHLDRQKKPQRVFEIFRPLKAIRLNCMDCSGFSPKAILWCPLDGVHSTRCHFWPYRFGIRPETVADRYGPELVTPELMPGANVNEDDLPSGMEAATRYLKHGEHLDVTGDSTEGRP